MVMLEAGTGGTLTGIAKKIKLYFITVVYL